jgi:hypothetical protein
MSRGGLLLCLGGLDRTGNTAAIGVALVFGDAGPPGPLRKGTALPKAGPVLVGLLREPLCLTPTLK